MKKLQIINSEKTNPNQVEFTSDRKLEDMKNDTKSYAQLCNSLISDWMHNSRQTELMAELKYHRNSKKLS